MYSCKLLQLEVTKSRHRVFMMHIYYYHLLKQNFNLIFRK